MVAVTAKKGYAVTSVADLVEVSGVSSRSFYVQFADKEECFLATLDEILTQTQRFTAAAMEADGLGAGRTHLAVEALVAMATAQPAAAKLCTVIAFGAGAAPRRRTAQTVGELSAL